MAINIYDAKVWSTPHVPILVYWYRRTFPAGYVLQPHRHEHAEIMYVEDGELTLDFDGSTAKFGPRDFVIINGNVRHAKMPLAGDCRILNCEFRFIPNARGVATTEVIAQRLTAKAWPLIPARPWVGAADVGAVGELLIDLVESLQQSGGNHDVAVELNFWRLIVEISRVIQASEQAADVPNLHVMRALRFMRRRYAMEISVSDISEHVGLHPAYFSRLFREVTGQSPSDVLMRFRLEKAKELLVRTDLPVKYICQDVGIPNQQYFCRLFRRREGVTPGEFRRKHEIPPPRVPWAKKAGG